MSSRIERTSAADCSIGFFEGRAEQKAEEGVRRFCRSSFLALSIAACVASDYADCFAAALAKLRNAERVTGDRDFKQIEAEIKIGWLK